LTAEERNENIPLRQMSNPKPETAAPNPVSDAASLNSAADQAIAACGGDAREAVKALLIANEFLEREMEVKVSHGYMRGVRHGRFKTYSG
jgi:hypothetical protein